MRFIPATFGTLVAFELICAAVVAAYLFAIHRASKRAGENATRRTVIALSIAVLWLGLDGLIVISGALEAMPMPGLPIFFVGNLLIAVAIALSPVGGRIARGLPIAALIGFQFFRFPLELVLHAWADQGTIPQTMTWTGVNYDVISGPVALIAALVGSRFPLAIRAANIIGLALLGNVTRVAILSSPLPFGWPVEPPLLLAFHFPYCLIVPVCIGGALGGHIIVIRALRTRGASR